MLFALSSIFDCFGKKQIVQQSSAIHVPDNASEKHAGLSIHSTSSVEPLEESFSSPSTKCNRALAVVDKRQYAMYEFPYPTLKHDGEVIIRTVAVGLSKYIEVWKAYRAGSRVFHQLPVS